MDKTVETWSRWLRMPPNHQAYKDEEKVGIVELLENGEFDWVFSSPLELTVEKTLAEARKLVPVCYIPEAIPAVMEALRTLFEEDSHDQIVA